MRKSKADSNKNKIDIENLAYEEEYEEAGFCDFIGGTTVATFNFQDNAAAAEVQPPGELPAEALTVEASPAAAGDDHSKTSLPDNRTLKSEPNGITPPIDGEYFSLRRTFAFRPSTVRLLNELKAMEPGINVYLSSIVDKALWHYYKFNLKNKD